MTRTSLIGALCVVAALSLTACGSAPTNDSASNSGTTTAIASFKAQLLEQSTQHTSPFTFDDSSAQCVARTVVDAVGLQQLQDYELLDANNTATDKTLDEVTMSTADASAVVNGLVDCLGVKEFNAALKNAVTSSITGKGAAAQRACLTTKLTADALKPMLIASLSGDAQAATAFNAELAACLSAQ